MHEIITSVTNPRVKQLVKLRNRRERDSSGVFLIEGYRELRRAADRRVALETLFVCDDLFLGGNEPRLIDDARALGTEVVEVGSEAFVVGGGARSPLWRSILADVLGLELKLPALADASAGAALIAAAGIGEIELDGTAPWAKTVDRVSPDPQRHDGYAKLLHIYRSTRDDLSDVGTRLRRISYT